MERPLQMQMGKSAHKSGHINCGPADRPAYAVAKSWPEVGIGAGAKGRQPYSHRSLIFDVHHRFFSLEEREVCRRSDKSSNSKIIYGDAVIIIIKNGPKSIRAI